MWCIKDISSIPKHYYFTLTINILNLILPDRIRIANLVSKLSLLQEKYITFYREKKKNTLCFYPYPVTQSDADAGLLTFFLEEPGPNGEKKKKIRKK